MAVDFARPGGQGWDQTTSFALAGRGAAFENGGRNCHRFPVGKQAIGCKIERCDAARSCRRWPAGGGWGQSGDAADGQQPSAVDKKPPNSVNVCHVGAGSCQAASPPAIPGEAPRHKPLGRVLDRTAPGASGGVPREATAQWGGEGAASRCASGTHLRLNKALILNFPLDVGLGTFSSASSSAFWWYLRRTGSGESPGIGIQRKDSGAGGRIGARGRTSLRSPPWSSGLPLEAAP